MLSAARNVLATFAGLAVIVSAAGWLYLVEPDAGDGGPRIGDALPLDELSRHAAVPLAIFLAVWGTAALLLGLLARATRTERLTAALLLALGVGFWGSLSTGVALVVVRQVSAHAAFHAAAGLRAIYVPALLAGLAGALCGRTRATVRPRAPLLLASAVAAAGMLGVLDAVLRLQGEGLLASFAPDRVRPLTSALVAPLGLALLLAARGLARRKRRAWQISLVLLGGSTALYLLHGFHVGAVASALVTLGLVARRHDFDALGDPEARPLIALRALMLALGIYAYAAVALWVNRLMVDQPFSLAFAARETGAALIGLRLRGSAHLAGDFGSWFPLSVFLAGLAGTAWLLLRWVGPWRYRLKQEARERRLAHDLVAAWGADTLAPFVLRADKSYFFSEDERSFVAYRVVGGVAIVSGDPVGPSEAHGELLDRFLDFARARGWRLAILGVSERCLGLYRARGLHVLYHGDEAVVETASFTLEGRPIRKVRQSVHRLARAGYTAEVLRPGEIGKELRGALEAIAREWRGGASPSAAS